MAIFHIVNELLTANSGNPKYYIVSAFCNIKKGVEINKRSNIICCLYVHLYSPIATCIVCMQHAIEFHHQVLFQCIFNSIKCLPHFWITTHAFNKTNGYMYFIRKIVTTNLVVASYFSIHIVQSKRNNILSW